MFKNVGNRCILIQLSINLTDVDFYDKTVEIKKSNNFKFKQLQTTGNTITMQQMTNHLQSTNKLAKKLTTTFAIALSALVLSACNTSGQETSNSTTTAKAQAQTTSATTGYTTTSSGLGYKVLKKGTGKSPTATDVVTVHYEGKLTNGKVFDSSYQRGEPASFPLNRVIAGWTEGLQLMQTGGKYEFYIPANLAYGDRATGSIPANSPLIFTVELIDVK